MKSEKSVYEVLWPLGKKKVEPHLGAANPDNLEGKTICELWNYDYGGNLTFPIIEELLKKQYPNIKFVNYSEFGSTHGPKEREVIEALPGKLAEHGCDVVISGNGG